jgi:4-hydroxy-3-methylbut-2-enyl diphosphate reductase
LRAKVNALNQQFIPAKPGIAKNKLTLQFMKTFQVPNIYRSPLISAVKNMRKMQDKLKKDFQPTLLDFGSLHVYLARHFGFCYGVENAIEIAFRIVEENPGKNIFLLSEMIHNPQVNADLQERGIRFLQDTHGKQLFPFEDLRSNDIVITPAFGTTLEIERILSETGIKTEQYNTTCPFVEKVWNRSAQIAGRDYTIVLHGKPGHEETRATFSHAASSAPTIIVKDIEEARILADFITGSRPADSFDQFFKGQYSPGFDIGRNLQRIGVVNQTTMLASDTQGIADFLKQTMISHYQLHAANIDTRFADTRDTLCYATLDNQTAVSGMLQTDADFAIIVGGYNSSNTSHLVELCETRLRSFFVKDESKLISAEEILHFDIHSKQELLTHGWMDSIIPLRVLITSGASCPDALVESVIRKLVSFIPGTVPVDQMISDIEKKI